MRNPICNTVFDSRDLIEYKDDLELNFLEIFNDNLKELIEEHNSTLGDSEDVEELDVINLDYFEDLSSFLEDNEEDYKSLLEEAMDYTDYERDELKKIVDFCEELESCSSDFEYGATIIHTYYFVGYAEQLVEDCGDLPKDLPLYIANNINWEGVADDLKHDYSSAEYEGETYYIR